MYSCGKVAVSLVVGILVDRGLLAYEAKVETYWPEFGKNGKEGLTLADILRHEGGLEYLEHVFEDSDFTRENIKDNCVGKWLQEEPAHWENPEISRRAYHSITRGWILNEIVRRVDPKGRTVGEILYDDVTSDGIFCGLPESQAHLVAPQQAKSLSWLVAQAMTPAFACDTSVEITPADVVRGILDGSKKNLKTLECLKGVSTDTSVTHKHWQQYHVRRTEQPSGNFNASARGMAWIAHIMANEGVDPKGKRVLSQEACFKMHSNPKEALDMVMGNLQVIIF